MLMAPPSSLLKDKEYIILGDSKTNKGERRMTQRMKSCENPSVSQCWKNVGACCYSLSSGVWAEKLRSSLAELTHVVENNQRQCVCVWQGAGGVRWSLGVSGLLASADGVNPLVNYSAPRSVCVEVWIEANRECVFSAPTAAGSPLLSLSLVKSSSTHDLLFTHTYTAWWSQPTTVLVSSGCLLAWQRKIQSNLETWH